MNNKFDIGKIEPRELTQEMQDSYIDYAMSVIVSRALPDVRDGLKPVHRRILYAMHDMGLKSGAKFRKSATVVGTTLGQFHPHGDIAIYDALARMAQDFSLRYPLIDGQGNFGCFTKDTKVKLTDCRSLTFGQLIEETKQGKKNYTYTFNQRTQEIEIAEIKNPRLTRKNEKIIKVILDNGKEIKCTLDHRFMLRDGTYKEAKDLRPEDSLMPFYTKLYDDKKDLNLKGYEMVYQPIKDDWEFIHHLADEWNLKNNIYEKSAGKIRHHLDFNKLNNNPENVLRIQWQDHWKYHKEIASKRHKTNPNYVYSLLKKYSKITPEIYQKERYNNCIPRIENALNYFESFSEILVESQKHNHKVVKTRILQKKEDVYDLTIEPYHNFALEAGVFVHNSVDGDAAAAMRYTECRLAPIAEELLTDIEKDTVDFIDNYDRTRKEPIVLPAKVPQLLLNGTMGIAVGMATNIPPHNLNEVIDATVYLADHSSASVQDLLEFIKGPDFPTGGVIYDRRAISQVYATGKGGIINRAIAEIIETKTNHFQIIVSEIPFQVNKADLVSKIAELVKNKKIEGIKDIRDESDKEGIRVVIDLKSDAYPKKILNSLYEFTDLQKVFYVNMLALVGGIEPRVLTLKMVLEQYLAHRRNVIERRTRFNLARAKERAHILKGLAKALDKIDQVIKTIKQAKDKEAAHDSLISKFDLSSLQATAILEMKLATLAALERQKIKDELKTKLAEIKYLEDLLAHPKKIIELIKEELKKIKVTYSQERRTKVFSQAIGEFKMEDLVADEEVILTLTHGGYIKRMGPENWRLQGRGGKGVMGVVQAKEDSENLVEHLFITRTLTNLLFFTSRGRVFQIKTYEIPPSSRLARGQAIVNFLALAPEEKVLAILEASQKGYIVMVTKSGIIKKVASGDFRHVRRSGIVAIKLKKDDALAGVKATGGVDEIILVTKEGQAIRFKEKDVRPMGRAAAGVKAIGLAEGDEVKGVDVVKDKKSKAEGSKEYLLVVTENGFGKRTNLTQYRLQHRAGRGIKTAKITSKTGKIVKGLIVKDEQEKELFAVSRKGQVIRIPINSISILSRATQGVRIMRLDKDDYLASVTAI